MTAADLWLGYGVIGVPCAVWALLRERDNLFFWFLIELVMFSGAYATWLLA